MPTNAWPFADPKNVAVFTTTQVVHDGRPVLYVSHDLDDGAWQFHTGDEAVSVKDAMVVALSKMIDIDPSLRELHDLPFGWIARRNAIGIEWVREPKLSEPQFTQLIDQLRRVQEDLCDRKMKELREILDHRSSSVDVIRVLDEYPANFVYPPVHYEEELSIIHLDGSSLKCIQLFIDMPLWSTEEGRSDLEVQLWAKFHENTWQIEISDIRVP